MIKYSRQREAIKEYLQSTKSHPTADTVYQNLKAIIPNISLGTVYRNLNFLTEHGEILKLDCGDGLEHFDADISYHNHFFCRECRSLIDLKMESIDHIRTIASANFSGLIETHVTYFTGLCPDCLKSNTDKETNQ